jgi:sarcosine oxidase subunit gamma
MLKLESCSALARFAGSTDRAAWDCATLSIREQQTPGLVRLQLLEDSAELRVMIGAATGVTLAGPGSLSANADLRCIWVAVGEWLWLTTPGGEVGLIARLAQCCGESAVSTTVTDARVCVRVQGDSARALLAKGTGLDVHAAAFAVGRCTSTRFAQITVMIAREDGDACFDLYVDRSQAAYLWQWLLDAAVEFAF